MDCSNNRISYQIIVSFILLFIIIVITTVIYNKDVSYEKTWKDFAIFFDVLLFIYFILMLSIYFKYLKYSKMLNFIYYILFISSSIFLLTFGTNTILTDEVIQKNGPDYYFLNLLNDNISVSSILIGFIVLFLTIFDFIISNFSSG